MEVIDSSKAASTVPEFIRAHESHVQQRICYRDRCQRCKQQARYTWRDMRRRSVRVVVGDVVRVFLIILVRWRCTACQYRFTDYPPFLLPYKRFAIEGLLPHCQDYLDDDGNSYDSVSKTSDGRPRWYVNEDGRESSPARALNKSTIWRWCTFLGLQTIALQHGVRLWMQHAPMSSIHRFEGAVAPHKHRSDNRGNILRTARRLLQLNKLWNHTFREPFLPRFATLARAP